MCRFASLLIASESHQYPTPLCISKNQKLFITRDVNTPITDKSSRTVMIEDLNGHVSHTQYLAVQLICAFMSLCTGLSVKSADCLKSIGMHSGLLHGTVHDTVITKFLHKTP